MDEGLLSTRILLDARRYDIDPLPAIVYYFLVHGEGVPQNRLMRADDSCRVENAEGSDVPIQALLPPPREVKLSGRLRTRNGAVSEYAYLLLP